MAQLLRYCSIIMLESIPKFLGHGYYHNASLMISQYRRGGTMKILLCGLLFSGILMCAINVSAQDNGSFRSRSDVLSEFRIGVMKHDVAVRSRSREEGQDINLELHFPPWRLFRHIGSPHPTMGGALNNESQTSQIYGGLTWKWKPLPKTFLNLGLGGAVHDAELKSEDPDTKRFATRALFRYAFVAGYQYSKKYNISLMFDHISNGGTAYPNNSVEKLGVQIGYTY